MASENPLYSVGSSAQCSVLISMGRMGGEVGERPRREGIYVYMWLIHFIIQQKLMQHCKQLYSD